MANSRKTQGEIDRLLKKITEGMDVYEDTYEKFQTASSTSLKERFESELKKEIKKLQRLREQIKALTTSGEVKDKKALDKARKDIEGKMEAFKGVEKETKTKTYSKEGLANGTRLDPADAAKHATGTWIRESISELGSQIESLEFDIESEGGSRKKRGGFDPKEERLQRSKFHVSKLEQLLRLMDNDELPADEIDAIQQDVQGYVEGNADDDYVEEFEDLYECFDLPEAPLKGEGDEDEDEYKNPKASPKTLKATDKKATPATTATVVTPPTSKATPKTPAAVSPAPIIPKKEAPMPTAAKKIAAQPAAKAVPPQPAGSVKQPAKTSSAAAAPVASPVRETPLPYAQVAQQAAAKQEAERKAVAEKEAKEREASAAAQRESTVQKQKMQVAQQQAAQQSLMMGDSNGGDGEELTVDDLLDDDDGLNDDTFGDDAMGGAGDGMADLSAMTAGAWNKAAPLPPKPAAASPNEKKVAKPISAAAATSSGAASTSTGPQPTAAQQQAFNQQQAAHQAAVTMLEQSVKNLPHPNDAERLKAYIPPNPYKTPSWYPQTIHPALTHHETLSKFEIEALFFIFYYQPNTYQQYLAAKELKKQSWRYHKKYLTWFQRHDTPKQTTDDFEQGAYIYFDFESGWCQRIKNDFTFKYQFLEDELQ